MSNPKKQHGDAKASLGLIPKVAMEAQAAAHQLGADKYGTLALSLMTDHRGRSNDEVL